MRILITTKTTRSMGAVASNRIVNGPTAKSSRVWEAVHS
jgi:hypothetical protein